MSEGAKARGEARQLAFWVDRVKWRPVLVDARIAMATLGLSAETIREMREAGELRWVWDVSVRRAEIEAPRFWFGELLRLEMGDSGARGLALGEVLAAVVGREQQAALRSRTVCQMLLITPPTLMALHRAGELRGRTEGHVRWIERSSLVEFLTRRLIA